MEVVGQRHTLVALHRWKNSNDCVFMFCMYMCTYVCVCVCVCVCMIYWGADKSLGRPTSRCILFDGENISFDTSLVIYINSTNIPPITIINRICEH
jgi:hypothetical protein